MGKGFLKQRKEVRAAQFNQLLREYQRVETENRELKTNPDGVIGQFLNKLEMLSGQNNKLSALAAAFIQMSGGSVKMPRAVLDSFGNHRVTIKVAGNADTDNDITEYEFTFDKKSLINPEPTPVTMEQPPVAEAISVESVKQ